MNNDPVAQMKLNEMKEVVEHDKLKGQAHERLEKALLECVPAAYRKGDVLPLTFYPSETLMKSCAAVDKFGRELRSLVEDMALTMYLCGGVGLAAPQVGKLVRVIVCDWGEKRGDLQALINPIVIASSTSKVRLREGCLSVPGALVHLERPEHVTVRCQDLRGEWRDLPLAGWPAHIIQHEIDHLDGKGMLDSLSQLERRFAVKGLEKMRRRETATKKKPGQRRR